MKAVQQKRYHTATEIESDKETERERGIERENSSEEETKSQSVFVSFRFII